MIDHRDFKEPSKAPEQARALEHKERQHRVIIAIVIGAVVLVGLYLVTRS
jgi:hypothetical protein